MKNYRILMYDNLKSLEPHYDHSNAFCITTTNKYIDYSMVTVNSIIANTDRGSEIIFLTDDIDQDEFIKKISKFHDYFFTIIFLNNVKSFENVYWPSIIAKRILLFTKFFSKFNKILSIESDVIINKNIDSLFEQNSASFITASLELSISNEICLGWKIPENYIKQIQNSESDPLFKYGSNLKQYIVEYLRLDINKYINAGVFLVSYKYFVDQGLQNKIEIMKQYVFLDQDFINKNLTNLITITDFSYNYNIGIENTKYEIFEKFNGYFNKLASPYIVHFSAGTDQKPWNCYIKNVFYESWWSYAKKYRFKFKVKYLYLKTKFTLKSLLLKVI